MSFQENIKDSNFIANRINSKNEIISRKGKFLQNGKKL